MELKEGMYVRTKKGIFQITNDKTFIENKIEYIAVNGRYTCIDVNTIIKASNNIIDLIEVGDYVNGYIVLDIMKNNLLGKYIECGCKDEIEYDYVYDTFYNEDIKSIVTKEQFESMQYKVGE